MNIEKKNIVFKLFNTVSSQECQTNYIRIQQNKEIPNEKLLHFPVL